MSRFETRRSSAFAALAACLLAATSVGATTGEMMTGEQMIAASEVIVVGRCNSAETRKVGRAVTTVYDVTVEDVLLGEATEVKIAVPGGIDTSGPVPISHNYHGAPQLHPNQSYLLFLTSHGGSGEELSIVGFSQGILPVEAVDGKAMVVERRAASARGMLLDAMKRQIRSHLKARESR